MNRCRLLERAARLLAVSIILLSVAQMGPVLADEGGDLAWIHLESEFVEGYKYDSIAFTGEQVVQNECATDVVLEIRVDGGVIPPYWVIYAAQLKIKGEISFPPTGLEKVDRGWQDALVMEVALPDLCGHDEFELRLLLPEDYHYFEGYNVSARIRFVNGRGDEIWNEAGEKIPCMYPVPVTWLW